LRCCCNIKPNGTNKIQPRAHSMRVIRSTILPSLKLQKLGAQGAFWAFSRLFNAVPNTSTTLTSSHLIVTSQDTVPRFKITMLFRLWASRKVF
jgi:hypothetical protein